ncbi:hypothetical protein ELI24_17810 [Rhizobium ruizarguesonis]|nr:hypothetical protein ELI24_17810 [Rhizobium ruizarguesonis]TAW17444.1 hypothetical protein ELI25_17255 [Rhizobium ruizarguesonis]TAZ52970.1 hypothetical protein ELH76_18260 [Rhizobium ruizarguesonis]
MPSKPDCRCHPHGAFGLAFNGAMIVDLDFLLIWVMLGVLSVVRSLAMVASNNTIVFQFGPTATSFRAPGGGVWFSVSQTRFLFGRSGASDRLRAAHQALMIDVSPPEVTQTGSHRTGLWRRAE